MFLLRNKAMTQWKVTTDDNDERIVEADSVVWRGRLATFYCGAEEIEYFYGVVSIQRVIE